MDPLSDVLRSLIPSVDHETAPGFVSLPAGVVYPCEFEGGLTSIIVLHGSLTGVGDAALVAGHFGMFIEPQKLTTSTQCLLYRSNYRVIPGLGQWLRDALPPAHVASVEGRSQLWPTIVHEAKRTTPAGQAALPHLHHVVLAQMVRALFEQSATPPGWFAGLADPVAGPVLRAMHRAPGKEWGLGELAQVAGVVRSTLNDHFSHTVGVPAKQYLIALRLDLAQTELLTTSKTLAQIAEDLGYSSPFSFSAAFKRHVGMSPAHFRTQNSVTA